MQKSSSAPRARLVFSAVTLIFFLAHAATAFVATYLKEMGLSASFVGTIMALLNCVGIVSSPVLGNFADKINSARCAFMIDVVLAGAIMACIPAFGAKTIFGIPVAAILLMVWAFFRIPANSLLDSWTLRCAEETGAFSFGSIRLIGSVSGATMCILYGQLAAKTGTNASILYGYSVFAALTLAFCIFTGRKYDDGVIAEKKSEKKENNRAGVRTALSSKSFLLFLLCHAAMGIPIYCLTTFLPYKLSELGASSDMLGTLVALKSYTEVPMLLFGAACLKKWDAKPVLTICFAAFFLEHLACALAGNVAIIAIALMAHGLFFGLYLAAMVHYVYRVAPKDAVASAQSLAGSAALLCAVLTNILGGVLVDHFGSVGFFTFGAVVFAIAFVLFVLTAKKNTKNA